ncbi:MAG: CHAT domain-containing protein [Oscillatoriophycideae cyanobacterium NC_groundwater_1537_Pr4_S-0.65um_50_18]|nr:CHAT domain-containing protein [Oscillatoriophycideae cyanobacterium NC_groundwater_1537_Pr4_S-0.65um_50_18]
MSRKWFQWVEQIRGHHQTTILFLIALFVVSMGLPIAAQQATFPQTALQTSTQILQTRSDANEIDQQGRQRYEAAQYAEAVTLWQQAIAAFQEVGDRFRQAQTLSNLSLAYQQLGNWTDAEALIQEALTLVNTPELPRSTERLQLLAQVWDVQGRLQLSRGDAETALTTWQQAADLYKQVNDLDRLVRNQINQAQALQTLGLYPQAQKQLTAATQTLQNQPDSALKAIGLRSLGNVLRTTGNLAESRQVLQQSLAVAEAISNSQEVGEAQLSLGTTAAAQEDTAAAIAFYQQAATHSILTSVPAQLHQLDLLLDTHQQDEAQTLLPQIQAQIDSLPLSRTAVYARIDFAQSLMKLDNQDVKQTAQALATALQQSRSLPDARAESYAIGTLGNLYEQTQQWSDATQLTQQALVIAQTLDAADIAYQWQWQLGRLLRQQQDMTGAIAAYDGAIKSLQAIRYDLVSVNPDVQFSFRDKVEPVYRQFVDLLLQPGAEPSQDNIRQARSTIEALQLAELDNFFRAACLAPKQQLDAVVDQADPTAAVIYATILSDRIEVILKIPQQPLRHYATFLPQDQVEKTLESLRRNIAEPDALRQTQIQSQQVYSWLIQPSESAIAQSHIKTIVFVLDGLLRNIPMAALYDGHQYLIEQYAIALSPSLQLFDPKPLQSGKLNALVVGLDQARQGFSRLPYVGNELKQIQSEVPSQVLLNQQFTTQAFQTEMDSQSFSIAHLATHGQFSSKADETFILAWDKTINVNELNTLLRARDQRPQPLELLVLSACETAAGDRRATLGLAGMAIRAGARSTIASLWSVNDESTALLMNRFYQTLINQTQPRAEALRQAQLTLLKTPEYQLPIFWAPYVLIGSWL